MANRNIDKLTLELTPGSESALVQVKRGDTVESFRASASSLANLFVNRYTTGFLPVSQDGVIYLEERDGKKLVVVQRGARDNHTLKWYANRRREDTLRTYQVSTPYLFGMYLLQPNGNGYTILRETIFCSSGSTLGAATPIYGCRWMGNCYENMNTGRNSNICWGTGNRLRQGVVQIASLPNFLNDYVTQPFNNDLGSSPNVWEDFTQTKRVMNFAGRSLGTLGTIIERAWG